MNRRDFLRRVALVTAGVVAADQLELLERLVWTPRKLWTGYSSLSTTDELNRILREVYADNYIKLLEMETPFLSKFPQFSPRVEWKFDLRVPRGQLYLLPSQEHAA